jgi:hypothetical protein
MTEMTQVEREARADNNIQEIDGPPRAYFEIPIRFSPDDTQLSVLQITYVTLIRPITQEHVEDNMQGVVAEQLVTAIKDQLFKIGGGIIWWRARPKLEVFNTSQGQVFKVRCRVATSPPLSDEAWDSLHRVKPYTNFLAV